jgi:hypothetical protein
MQKKNWRFLRYAKQRKRKIKEKKKQISFSA